MTTTIVVDKEVFHSFLEAVCLLSEVKIRIAPEGIHVANMDSSHNTMTIVEVNKEQFNEFDPDEKNSVIEIETDTLKRINLFSDLLTITLEDNKIRFVTGKTTITAYNIDTLTEEYKEPTLDLTDHFTITKEERVQVIKSAFGNPYELVLTLENKNLTIMSTSLNDTTITETTVEIPDKVEESYTLRASYDFLSPVLKTNFSELNFSVAKDVPLKITHKGSVSVTWIIAPRVERE